MVPTKAKLPFTMLLTAVVVVMACAFFHRAAYVTLKTTVLLGAFIYYIPLFAYLLSKERLAPRNIARLFIFGGFGLLILGFIVWIEFNGYQSSPSLTEEQKRALVYYQQFAVLFSSSLGGSSVFHGIRRFSEITNDPKNV